MHEIIELILQLAGDAIATPGLSSRARGGSGQEMGPPYCRMDELMHRCDTVVYCEEMEAERKERLVVTCKVLRVYKGDLAPGAGIKVFYDIYLKEDNFFKPDREELPAARVLLFLHKSPDGIYGKEEMILAQKGKVYRFRPGYESNVLAYPENIQLPEERSYDEEALLEDAEAAQKTLEP